MIFWLIQFLPLASAALILLFLRRNHSLAATVSVLAAVVNAFLALTAFSQGMAPPQRPAVWIEIGLFQLEFGFVFDNLARLMLMIVTGVGAIIHIFSVGYMDEDKGQGRYFGYLSLFMFSMIGIVLANNFIQMFIFWELVGLSSYLLIGFWFERDSAAQAAKKAFLVNKLGDFGFMLGILSLWMLVGTFNFHELAAVSNWPFHHVGALNVFGNVISLDITITAAALLIFCGAAGKSAQFPLHVWLPDAMEGPTPVSALIHAATMVAAGVYMLARVYFLISDSAAAMAVIAAVGAITALMSAVIATQQNDIKRILAYSTLSQLGLMVMAIGGAGVYGYSVSMFHLTTHAFFKALLFLGAGSLIIGLHHEQNIWKMGGLSGKMWLTFFAFLVGAFALMGVPGFSGFYSKEDLLSVLYAQSKILFIVAEITAFFTAFYMTRLLVVAFIGLPRSEAAMHARESGPWMTVPLLILAVFSWIAGSRLLRPQSLLPAVQLPEAGHTTVFATSMVMLGLGFTLAALIYWNRVSDPLSANILAPIRRKFYFDELYDYLVRNIQGTFAMLLSFIDQWVIDIMLFRGSAALLRGLGDGLRRLQTGSVQIYAFLFGAGAVLLIWWELLR